MKSYAALAGAALAAVALVFTPAIAKKKVVHHKPKPHLCALATASGRTAKLVTDATRTMYDFRGSIPTSLLREAKGVIVVPALVKVGFIIGGQGGDGVLLRRNAGVWSYPAFYSLGSPSLGLQAGIPAHRSCFC